MKLKDLFKKVETANQIAKLTNGEKYCISVDVDGLLVSDVDDWNETKFDNWNRFAPSLASDFSEIVCKAVGSDNIKHVAGSHFEICIFDQNGELTKISVQIQRKR